MGDEEKQRNKQVWFKVDERAVLQTQEQKSTMAMKEEKAPSHPFGGRRLGVGHGVLSSGSGEET